MPTWKRSKHPPVAGEGGIEFGDVRVVQTGADNSCLQIIVAHHIGYAAEIKEGMFEGAEEVDSVLCPHRFLVAVAGAGEGHPQYPGAVPVSFHWMQCGRTAEEVNLGFFARRVLHHPSHSGALPLEVMYEAFDARVTVTEAEFFPEVLPDALGAQAPVKGFPYIVAVGLTRAR